MLEGWPENLNYLLASAVIGLYWVHHHFSGAINRTTGHYLLLATVLFLTMIGYIAFPVRAFTESLLHAEAVPASAAFLACSLALTSLTWLLKWMVGNAHGHVDAQLDPAYLARLTRRYQVITVWNVAAAVLVVLVAGRDRDELDGGAGQGPAARNAALPDAGADDRG